MDKKVEDEMATIILGFGAWDPKPYTLRDQACFLPGTPVTVIRMQLLVGEVREMQP